MPSRIYALLGLLLILLGFSAQASGPALGAKCYYELGQLVPKPVIGYTTKEFTESRFRERLSPEYQAWAGETANEVSRLYAEGKSMEEIVGHLANARNALAVKMGEVNAPAFGKTRSIAVETLVGYPSESHAFSTMRSELQRWVKRIESEKTTAGQSHSRPIEYRDLEYETLEGKKIKAGRVYRFTDTRNASWQIEHPVPADSQLILADSMKRFDRLRKPGAMNSPDATVDFSVATAGWFLATPWERGSAGAGSPLAAGIALSLTGRPSTLPADLDLFVMTGPGKNAPHDLGRNLLAPALKGFPVAAFRDTAPVEPRPLVPKAEKLRDLVDIEDEWDEPGPRGRMVRAAYHSPDGYNFGGLSAWLRTDGRLVILHQNYQRGESTVDLNERVLAKILAVAPSDVVEFPPEIHPTVIAGLVRLGYERDPISTPNNNFYRKKK